MAALLNASFAAAPRSNGAVMPVAADSVLPNSEIRPAAASASQADQVRAVPAKPKHRQTLLGAIGLVLVSIATATPCL
jgi:hypothetical protein